MNTDETAPDDGESPLSEDESPLGDDESAPGEDESAPGDDESAPGDDESAPPEGDDLAWIETRLRTRLEAIRITTPAALLARARCAQGRRALASELDTRSDTVLHWAAVASLLRMPELAPTMASRLVAAGVDGPPCLAAQRPELLRARLHALQPRLDLPSLGELQALIDAAAPLPRALWY